jgi:predicted nucleic acid-binding Zn ribbon protein
MDRAFDILLSLQRGTSLHGRWVLECLKGSWAGLVGAKLAAVCRPAELKDAVLKVEVVDSAWLETVRGLQPELQDKLSSVTGGEVKRLKIS